MKNITPVYTKWISSDATQALSSYESNPLNQYTKILQGETPFTPEYDAAGNQTRIQSSTGIWTTVYNAENRPIRFTKTEGDQTTLIECDYDYLGRR